MLKLNEETNTWKLESKKKRKSQIHRGRVQLQSSFVKLQSFLKLDNADEFRFRMVIALLFMMIFIVMLATRYFYFSMKVNKSIYDQIYVNHNIKKITFLDKSGQHLLRLDYGQNIPQGIKPINCRSLDKNKFLCLDWEYRAFLTVQSERTEYPESSNERESITCYRFKWNSYQIYSELRDCFDISQSFW